MQYDKLVQEQYKLTSQEYKPFVSAISKGYSDLIEQSRISLSLAYSKHLEGLKGKEYYLEMVKYDRLDTLLKELEGQLAKTYSQTYKSLLSGGSLNVTNMYWRTLYSVEWAGATINAIINPVVVEAAVSGSIKVWKDISKKVLYQPLLPPYGTLSNLLNKNKLQDIEKVREVLTSGLIRGQSFSKTAVDLKSVYDTSFSNAMRIARTEGIRNLNAGSYYLGLDASELGLEILKMWDATLDTRTRETHSRADRQKVIIDENFKVGNSIGLHPGALSEVKENVNCRCSSVNIPDGIEPETRRARDPVKEMQWNNATPKERKSGFLADGTKIYPRSQQTDIIENTSFTKWMELKNLKYNSQGKIVVS